MKRKILFLPVLLLTLFLLTACDSEDTTTQGQGAFIGGTQGVTADFEQFGVEEEGVYSIFDTETFPIEVTLHNKGEYEIALKYSNNYDAGK